MNFFLKKSKAIFLDRDGTINVEKHYVFKTQDFEFLPGVPQGMKLLCDAGFELVIITNQSGIARGFYSEADYAALDLWLKENLASAGVKIAASYFCPHHPNAKIAFYKKRCECRKPGTALFFKAVFERNIDLAKSFAVGDKIRDLAICEMSDCRGFLIGHNEKKIVVQKAKAGDFKNVEWAENFDECAKKILLKDKNF